MTLVLKSELAAALENLAAAQGLSVEDYLERLVERELPAVTSEPASPDSSGMVRENGLLVYRTGKPLPARVVDEALRRSREERSKHLLGNLS
ncbi:MAG: hypothetical protein ACLQVL_08795 [Terriglobia bacterium]